MNDWQLVLGVLTCTLVPPLLLALAYEDVHAAVTVYPRTAWNYVQAKLHHAYPCGRCGYRYDCPDGECHS